MNQDLVWDIALFRERKNAALFIKSFEHSFCIFSGSVNQLYTNFTIHFPEADPTKIIILPNQYKYHDTFNGVPECAVKSTRLQIIRTLGKVPMIRIPFRTGKRLYHTLPLYEGLALINRSSRPDDPFLPVLMKGDLRELDIATPYLVLHRLSMPALKKLSAFEQGNIKNSIVNKLRMVR